MDLQISIISAYNRYVPIYLYIYHFLMEVPIVIAKGKAKFQSKKKITSKSFTATLNRPKVRQHHDSLNQSSIKSFQHVDSLTNVRLCLNVLHSKRSFRLAPVIRAV